MDQEGPTHPSQDEEVYFDSSNIKYIGFKTLALFVYHPVMQHFSRE